MDSFPASLAGFVTRHRPEVDRMILRAQRRAGLIERKPAFDLDRTEWLSKHAALRSWVLEVMATEVEPAAKVAPSLYRCSFIPGFPGFCSERCTADATVWLYGPDAEPNPGGYLCEPHARQICREYLAGLGETWTYKPIGTVTLRSPDGRSTVMLDRSSEYLAGYVARGWKE